MKLYILASKGKSWQSRVIRWYQWGFAYTHVALVMPLQDRSPNPLVIEAWKQGVRKNYFFDAHTKGTPFDIFGVDVTVNQAAYAIAFAEAQIGKGYDYFGVMDFLFRKPPENPDHKWFCSELVFASFLSAGVRLIENVEAYEVSPKDLLSSSMIQRRV